MSAGKRKEPAGLKSVGQILKPSENIFLGRMQAEMVIQSVASGIRKDITKEGTL